jgi:hypothetical protein
MNLDSLSLEQLQALRAQKISAAPRQVTKDDSFLDSMATGVKKRAAGVGELGLKLAESLGADVKPYREDLADIQQRYQAEGEGTGAIGLAGEILGDPLTYLPIGGGAANVARGLAGQGALSGLTTGTGDAESGLGDNAINAAIQAGTGAVAGKVGQKLMRPVSNQLDDVAAKNVALLQREGVALQPSQKVGSKTLNLVEEAFKGLPFTAGKQAKIGEKQLQQFTSAALKRAGVKSSLATPEVMANAAKRFDKIYTGILKKAGGIRVDNTLLTAAAEAEAEATKRMGKDAGKLVSSYVDDILASGGVISPEIYKNTRTGLRNIIKGSNDPLAATVLGNLRTALDDAADRSITPALRNAWKKVNTQYAAYKTIDKAMTSTGDAATSGLITPANLLNATKVGNKQFARGGGVLTDLARAGKDVISSTLPDSGTATRTMMQNVMTGGAFAGAGGAAALGNLPLAAGALALPRITQEIYNTPVVQKYLTEGITDSAIPAIAAGKAAIQGAMQSQGIEQPEQPFAPPAIDLDSMSLEELQQLRNQKMQTPDVQLPATIPDTQPQASLLNRIMQAESGGRPMAMNDKSTAAGLYQFTDGTWASMVKKYGNAYGITKADKMNPQAQQTMANLLLQENGNILTRSLGRNLDDGDYYVAHVLGAGDAARMLKAHDKGKSLPAAQLVAKGVPSANRGIFYDGNRPRSVKEVVAILKNKVKVT